MTLSGRKSGLRRRRANAPQRGNDRQVEMNGEIGCLIEAALPAA